MARCFLLLSFSFLFIETIAQPSAEEIKKYHISKVIKNRTIGESAFPETYWYDRRGNDSARMINNEMSIIKNTFKGGKLISTVYVGSDNKETNKLEYAYDADGSYKVTTTDGEFGMKSYEWYNPKKKIIKSRSPDGNTTTFKYNARGNLISVSSDGYNYGIKIKRNYFYNPKNQLTKAEEEMDGVKSITVYTYNIKGQLIKKDEEEDGMKTSTSYIYDGKGKVIKQILTGDSPLGPSTTTSIYEYNEKGLLVKLTSKRIVEEQEESEPDEITVYEYEYF